MPHIYSPAWFFDKDIIIDIVSIVILLLIGYFAWQFHKFNRKKESHVLLAISFFTLGAAFLFKILTNFILYHPVVQTQQIGPLTFSYLTIHYNNIFQVVGTALYQLLTLAGLYLLYSLYYKKQLKSSIFFMAYFIIILTIFSLEAYYLFHLTAFLFLALLVWKMYTNYRKTKDKAGETLLISFSIIALSQILFMFVGLNLLIYVFAELVQLLGYIFLLSAFIMVLRYAKKR